MERTLDDNGLPRLTSVCGEHYAIPCGDSAVDAKRLPLGLFGMESNHLHRALVLDDDDAMRHWLTECGGVSVEVFGSSLQNYVKSKGGAKCQRMLIRMQKEALKA